MMKFRSVSISSAFSLITLLTSLLGSALTVTPVYATGTTLNTGVDVAANGQFEIAVWSNGAWQTAGILPFGMMFARQQIDLSSFMLTEPALILVTHIGATAAHIDMVTFGGQTPVKIQGASESAALVTRKLAARDYDVIDASRKSYIFTFPPQGSSSMLTLVARIEPEINTGLPFRFPAANFAKVVDNSSEFYSYTLNSASGALNVNGDLSDEQLGTPFIKEWSAPTSGHPSNYTYVWVFNDARSLYVAIDFTPDNTMDGENDFTAVFVKTANGVQRFKASVPEQQWGMPGFVYTDRAAYQHKVYEYKIPLKQIGFDATESSIIELTFEAYGTASVTSLTSSQNPSADGQSVTFTAISSGSNNVTFKVDGLDIPGCVSVSTISNVATCTTSSLTVGNHTITAVGGYNTIDMTGNPQVVTGTCYVKASAAGTNNGLSWTNAFVSLQSALSAAYCTEIWVASGTYKPTTGSDRLLTFTLKNNVGVYGGFAGTETLRTQRNPATNVTILSGDIGTASVVTDNSYHVVTGSGTNNTAVLEGFTVTDGNGKGDPDPRYNTGGGLYNDNGSPTLTNITFSGNSAEYGGGVGNQSSSNPVLTNVTFNGNTATGGGGMFNGIGSNPTLTNVTFSGNTAYVGGGVYNVISSPTLTNVTFSGNTATGGGGMKNSGDPPFSSPTLKNVIIANNTGGDCILDLGSTVNALSSNNLIKDTAANACGLMNGENGNITGSDPLLGALANNGGPTRTMALLPGSPAIDAGDPATCLAPPVNNLDQRGVARTYGTKCDIGAYELKKVSLTSLSVGAHDGFILEWGETTNVGGTRDATSTTFRLGDEAANEQYRAILSFNTATLPDNAVITKVTLKIKRPATGFLVGNNGPFTWGMGLKVDMRKPFFGTTAGLAITDFQAAAGKTPVATFNATPASNWYSALLNAVGRAYVNKTGTTQFRLRFFTDDNNNNAADYMKFYSGDAPLAYRPQLIVEYYVP